MLNVMFFFKFILLKHTVGTEEEKTVTRIRINLSLIQMEQEHFDDSYLGPIPKNKHRPSLSNGKILL